MIGARGRNRTDMPLRALDFESSASTSSTTRAHRYLYSEADGVRQVLSAALRVPFACTRRRAFRVRFPLGTFPARPVSSDVDRRSIDHVLDMRGVEFLDHLDAGAAVL